MDSYEEAQNIYMRKIGELKIEPFFAKFLNKPVNIKGGTKATDLQHFILPGKTCLTHKQWPLQNLTVQNRNGP